LIISDKKRYIGRKTLHFFEFGLFRPLIIHFPAAFFRKKA